MMKTSLSPIFWLQIVTGAALAALGAALLIFAMPPYGLWPLATLGFVPMLLAQHRILPARLSSLAPAITIGGFLGILIPAVFGEKVREVWFLHYMGWMVAAGIFLAARGDRALHARTGYRFFVLEGAFVWVGIEMIRNLIPFLGTAGFIGYAYFKAPWLIQPVSLFGIFGLNLLTLVAGYTLGLGVLSLWDRRFPPPNIPPVPGLLARRWLLGVGAVSAAWAALSLALYFQPLPSDTMRVAAVQPEQAGLTLLKELSEEAARQGAQLVVWPEGALPYDPQKHATRELQNFARTTGLNIVMGYGLRIPQGIINEAAVLNSSGDFLGTYAKAHPITYLGETSLTRGHFPAFAIEPGTIGAIICYDLEFNDAARKVVGAGARLLAAPSNDWANLYDKQLAYVIFRAVENRVPVIKADSGYDSLIVDARGRVIAESRAPHPHQALLVADVNLGSSSPHALLGDWVGWASLAGMLVFSFIGIWEPRWNTLLKTGKRPAGAGG